MITIISMQTSYNWRSYQFIN